MSFCWLFKLCPSFIFMVLPVTHLQFCICKSASIVYDSCRKFDCLRDICRKIAWSLCRNFAGSLYNWGLSEICLRLATKYNYTMCVCVQKSTVWSTRNILHHQLLSNKLFFLAGTLSTFKLLCTWGRLGAKGASLSYRIEPGFNWRVHYCCTWLRLLDWPLSLPNLFS